MSKRYTSFRWIRMVMLVCMLPALQAWSCLNDHYGQYAPLSGTAPEQLLAAVNGASPVGPDEKQVAATLALLEATPQKDKVDWWNDLGGANIRLGRYDKAVELLREGAERFPNDYAVHANLGTAYHLLGQYAAAEKEIARDLEINPRGHDGLEVYHLALLQYLAAPKDWQASHLFLDEWTDVFFSEPSDKSPDYSLLKRKPVLEANLGIPAYRRQFNLARSPEQERGVSYMTMLNQREPACFVMAGLLALKSQDGETAVNAFNKAIQLGSPQAERLRFWIAWIDEARQSVPYDPYAGYKLILYSLALSLLGLYFMYWVYRRFIATR